MTTTNAVRDARMLLLHVTRPAWDRGGRQAVAERLSELQTGDGATAVRRAINLLGLDRDTPEGEAEFARLIRAMGKRPA